MPRPKPRSALKVWRTARRRPLARCATERLRWPPIRKDTPQPRLTRQDPSLHPSLVSLPCKPRLSLHSGYLCWCPPTHSSAALARLPGQQCANTRFAMSQPQGWVMALYRSFRLDGSHRYGLGKCHPLPFRSLSGQRDGFRLRLRSCAPSSLNSRGMVVILDLHCAATDSCTARVNASAHCVRRDRPIGLQGSWRAAKKPASPRCGHYARTCPITAQLP